MSILITKFEIPNSNKLTKSRKMQILLWRKMQIKIQTVAFESDLPPIRKGVELPVG